MITQFVRISAKAKRITLQRWLLGRLVFDTEEFSLTDLCCLFENQLWLERKVQTDPDFNQKFGKSLEDLSIIMKEINFKMEYSDRALLRFRNKVKEMEDFVLPSRNYFSLRPTMKGLFSLEPSSPMGKSLKQIPPKARIGIGYRDKGSARDLAYDGSPKWQEVAAHRGPLYKNGVPNEEIPSGRTTTTVASRFLEGLGKLGK